MFVRSLILCLALVASSSVFAEKRLLCINPEAGNAHADAVLAEEGRLHKEGYVMVEIFEKKVERSYVGTGLSLRYLDELTMTAVAFEALPGSPAARTGFFNQPYIVLGVDGKDATTEDIATVTKMILGDGKPGTGVVLTLQREDGGREYTRFLKREHIVHTREITCLRFEKK